MVAMIRTLREQLDATLSNIKAMQDQAASETRDLTQEEQTRFDELLSKSEKLQTDIERHERLAAVQAAAERVERKTEPMQPRTSPPTPYRIEVPQVHGQLRAFKGSEGARDAYRAGRIFLATVRNHTPSREWCEREGIDLRAYQAEGINQYGGFAVPTEMSRAIIDLRNTYGVARRECDVMPMSSDTMLVPKWGDSITVTFTGENAAATETNETLSQVQLTAKKVNALIRVSQEVADDAIVSMIDGLTDRVAWKLAAIEDQCLFAGTGASTYGGIYGLAPQFDANQATWAGVQAAASGHDTFAEIDADDLTALMAKLPDYARPNAKWFCSPQAKALIFDALKIAGGGNSIATLSGGTGDQFLGYPIVTSPYMPTAGANDDVAVIFGDMRQAVTFGDRSQVVVKVSNDRYFEYDQIGLLVTTRFDIVPHSLGDATNAGSLVALVGTT